MTDFDRFACLFGCALAAFVAVRLWGVWHLRGEGDPAPIPREEAERRLRDRRRG